MARRAVSRFDWCQGGAGGWSEGYFGRFPALHRGRYARGWRMHSMEFSGRGNAVVLVHGVGLSHRYMMPTAEAIASRWPVYVPDLPGFGYSFKPGRTLDVDELANALAWWMAAAGLPKAAMLGNSFGCQVIISLAARYPELVSRAVLQGPTVDAQRRTWRKQFQDWRRNGEYEHSMKKDAITYLDYLQAGIGRPVRTFHHAMRDRPENKLPDMKCPTLVVRGSLDPIVSQQWAERMVRLLPRGELAILRDCSHTLTFMAPDELAEVARPFLADGAAT